MQEFVKKILYILLDDDIEELKKSVKEMSDTLKELREEQLRIKRESFSHRVMEYVSFNNIILFVTAGSILGVCVYFFKPDVYKSIFDSTMVTYKCLNEYVSVLKNIGNIQMSNSLELEKEIEILLLKINESNTEISRLQNANINSIGSKVSRILSLLDNNSRPGINVDRDDIDS